jgi:transposase, IS5 family
MREKRQKQMPLMTPATTDHPKTAELERISRILDENPIIYDLVMQDIESKSIRSRSGAKGMTAEQVIRAAIIKQMFEFTYEDLAFHIVDSKSIRRFCLIGFAEKGFKKSVLNKHIKAISPKTWEAIKNVTIDWAKTQGIEKGREVRVDCTVMESHIHEPRDSSLLFDVVRVLARLLKQIEQSTGKRFYNHDHTRRAKRRMLGILNAKTKKDRDCKYKDLMKVTHRMIQYAQNAINTLESNALCDPTLLAMITNMKQYVDLSLKVEDQTRRRVIHDEKVPASEKVVSIFEPHTDIIIKDRRDTFYGHKICLTGGKSNLILDCVITEGNPADSSLALDMLDRQKRLYGRYPLKVAFDGGFASKENLKKAKERQIKDVCFAKKRGLEVAAMCRSQWVYKRLRNFRAGIESGISWIKRCFGFARCTWKGLRSFKSYVWASIVAANLLTLARKQSA